MKRTSIFVLIAFMAALSTSSMAQSEFSSGLIGVGVVSRDLNKSLDFYLNVIGMTKVSEFDVDAEFSKTSGLTGGIPFHVEVLKLEDDPKGTDR